MRTMKTKKELNFLLLYLRNHNISQTMRKKNHKVYKIKILRIKQWKINRKSHNHNNYLNNNNHNIRNLNNNLKNKSVYYYLRNHSNISLKNSSKIIQRLANNLLNLTKFKTKKIKIPISIKILTHLLLLMKVTKKMRMLLLSWYNWKPIYLTILKIFTLMSRAINLRWRMPSITIIINSRSLLMKAKTMIKIKIKAQPNLICPNLWQKKKEYQVAMKIMISKMKISKEKIAWSLFLKREYLMKI